MRFADGSSEVRTLLDDDNDGVIRFDFDSITVDTFVTDGDCLIWDIDDGDTYPPQTVPLFVTGTNSILLGHLKWARFSRQKSEIS